MLSFAVLSSRGFISVVPLRIPAHGPVSRCLFGTEAPVLSKQAIEIQQNKQNQRALFVRHERLEECVFQKNRPPQSYWPTLACKTKKDDASSEGYGVVGHLKHLQCSSLYTSTNTPQYPKWRKSRLKKKIVASYRFLHLPLSRVCGRSSSIFFLHFSSLSSACFPKNDLVKTTITRSN